MSLLATLWTSTWERSRFRAKLYISIFSCHFFAFLLIFAWAWICLQPFINQIYIAFATSVIRSFLLSVNESRLRNRIGFWEMECVCSLQRGNWSRPLIRRWFQLNMTFGALKEPRWLVFPVFMTFCSLGSAYSWSRSSHKWRERDFAVLPRNHPDVKETWKEDGISMSRLLLFKLP